MNVKTLTQIFLELHLAARNILPVFPSVPLGERNFPARKIL
jgi:hypothetical protein